MNDQQFLQWVHDRLARVHNEPELVDYGDFKSAELVEAIQLAVSGDEVTAPSIKLDDDEESEPENDCERCADRRRNGFLGECDSCAIARASMPERW